MNGSTGSILSCPPRQSRSQAAGKYYTKFVRIFDTLTHSQAILAKLWKEGAEMERF